jgi:hypothetical protein
MNVQLCQEGKIEILDDGIKMETPSLSANGKMVNHGHVLDNIANPIPSILAAFKATMDAETTDLGEPGC